MRHTMKALCLATALVASMPASASSTQNGYGEITAFNGVNSSVVSTEEQVQVSGEIAWGVLVWTAGRWVLKRVVAASINSAFNKLQCGTWSICKAY